MPRMASISQRRGKGPGFPSDRHLDKYLQNAKIDSLSEMFNKKL